MAIRHGHSSSRFDKPTSTLIEQVGRATSSGKDANLLTFTEIGTKERAEALATDGWGKFTPHKKTEAAAMWDKHEFDKVAEYATRLGDGTFHRDGGSDAKVVSASVVLDHTSGKRLWLSVLHCPSGVQEGDHFSTAQTDADRVKCWKEGVNAWEQARHDARDKYAPDLFMHVADWNVDCRLSEWRQEIDQRIGPNKFRGTWTKENAPKDGTLGKRLIDATWTNGTFKQTMLLPDDASSDHRPYGEVIAW